MLKLLGQKKCVALLLCCLFWGNSALGFQGKLVKVLDGDTVEVMRDGRAVRIRLAEIDTPEKGQPFGSKAKRFVLNIAAGEIVRVRPTDQDRYGRTIGEIILPDDRSLNRLLVKRGYAWWYRQYSSDQSLGELEHIARKNSRGLWADPEPIAPWQRRRGERTSPPKRFGIRVWGEKIL